MSMTLSDILRAQEEFDREHSGGRGPFYVAIDEGNLEQLEHLVVCLVGELGEFSNILKKVVRGDRPLEQAKAELDEELVDCFIYLLKIANQFGVDLENGYLKKRQANSERFPGVG